MTTEKPARKRYESEDDRKEGRKAALKRANAKYSKTMKLRSVRMKPELDELLKRRIQETGESANSYIVRLVKEDVSNVTCSPDLYRSGLPAQEK